MKISEPVNDLSELTCSIYLDYIRNIRDQCQSIIVSLLRGLELADLTGFSSEFFIVRDLLTKIDKMISDFLQCIEKLDTHTQVKLLYRVSVELKETYNVLSNLISKIINELYLSVMKGQVESHFDPLFSSSLPLPLISNNLDLVLTSLHSTILDSIKKKINNYMYNKIKVGIKEATDPTEFVALKLREKYPENQYLRLMESFRILWRINKMCDSKLKTEDLIEELKLLKRYTSGSKEVTKVIEEFLKLLETHIGKAVEYVPNDYREKTKKFAERLLDIWIAEILEK